MTFVSHLSRQKSCFEFDALKMQQNLHSHKFQDDHKIKTLMIYLDERVPFLLTDINILGARDSY